MTTLTDGVPPTQGNPTCVEAARTALSHLNCPSDEFFERRAVIVAQHLAEIEGRAVVIGTDGAPRTRPLRDGSGRDEAFPVTALIEELLYRLHDRRAPAGFRQRHALLRWR